MLDNQDVVGTFFEDLILVQDERWRRALGMQVERLCEAQGILGYKDTRILSPKILNILIS